jgi:uncharacterized repeat protein (TIGR01451 family)
MLLSGNIISGYVYHDANNNGIFDTGETPIANANLQLVNSQNQVISTATSDANGYYQFVTDDSIDTSPVSVAQTVTIPPTSAGFDITKQINQFNPNLGQLLEVDITQDGAITSDIKAENVSTQTGATITGTVSGSLTLTGAGLNIASTLSDNAGTFNAQAFDGTIDFGGTSGKDFGAQTATAATKSITLTGNQMNAFIGNGQLNFDEIAQVSSTASGGGNLIANITSTANATFTVVYKYRPGNSLRAGNYTIVETQEPLLPGGQGHYLDGKESQNNVVIPNSIGTDVIPVTLAGQDVPNNDFGELMPASLTGNVYFDANNNGVLDSGENGIGGVTVTLTGTDYTGQAVSLSTTTAGDGSYGFINLRPGTYTLAETQPAGWLDGKDSVGSLGGAVSNDQFSNIVVGSGAAGANYNFGELKGATLSGYVYNDVNDNGVKEQGENGIGGVTVVLTGTDDLGPVSRSVQTAADGSYSFNNLRPGTYTITETQPAGYLDGKDSIGTQGGTSANDQFSNVVLGNGAQGINNNFGELLPASLAGNVYVDANNNGTLDPGELGIGGVALTLVGTDDNGQAVSLAATTAADGTYKFANLRPGTYALNETQPAGYLDGKDTLGTQGGVLTNDHIASIALSQGLSGTNNNFGELLPGSLAGFVYDDSNNNGVKDSGEHGIGGVAIMLTGTNDQGPVSLSTTTAADGSYKFDNLRPGTYAIQETQPANYQDGADTIGSLGGTVGNDLFTNIALAQGNHGTDYDFGEINPSSLAGNVYHDTNENGILDPGESGIAGVTLKLTGQTASGNPVSLTTQTAADGSYIFDHLQAGTYSIQETQPGGWLDGKDSVGSAGGVMTNDNFASIVLGEGTHGNNYNFGELQAGSLAGHVWQDDNNNGVIDPGEQGIGGVVINLSGHDDLGNTVTQQTTTAADGSYNFGNLRPGTYNLDEVQPASYVDGKDSLGSLGGTLANDHFGSIVVNDGQAGVNYNFGERVAADLFIQKSVIPTSALPGSKLTYTLKVGNNGPFAAQNVQVVDTLPTRMRFVSAAGTGWTVTQVANRIIFTESSMAAGAFSTITITAVAPLTAGIYTNTAVVSSATLDTNTTNNQSSAKVTVHIPTPSPETPPSLLCVVSLYASDNWLALLRSRMI